MRKYEQKFKERWGVSYDGFKKWLKREYNLLPSDLAQVSLDEFTGYYKAQTATFRETYGLRYDKFKTWLKNVKGVSIGSLNKDYSDYIEEYTYIYMKNKLTKDEIFNLLWKNISGKTLLLTEKEKEVVKVLKGVEIE
jgi:hypothetical protein